MIFAVIDTNVLVSALLTHNLQSPTFRVINAIFARQIVPMYNEEIIGEYSDVLHRPKFGFSHKEIVFYLRVIKEIGIKCQRVTSNAFFSDPEDIVFYEVALSKEKAYLVTGNKKHFPNTSIVVTPAEMMEILQRKG